MGKYLALGHSARSPLSSVRTPWPRAKYFPIRPSHSQSNNVIGRIPAAQSSDFVNHSYDYKLDSTQWYYRYQSVIE